MTKTLARNGSKLTNKSEPDGARFGTCTKTICPDGVGWVGGTDKVSCVLTPKVSFCRLLRRN